MQYVVYAPFLWRLVKTVVYGTGAVEADDWCVHMFWLVVARYFLQQLWVSVSRLHCLTKKRVVRENDSGFEQVDREFHS